MEFQNLQNDLINIFPDLIIVFAIILNLIFACFKNSINKIFYTSAFGLLIPFVIYVFSGREVLIRSFYSSFQLDKFSLFFIILILFSSLVALFVSQKMVDSFKEKRGEFYIFLLSATLGAVFLVKAIELISIFVSLELLSISSYFLISCSRNKVYSIEGTMKYFVFSSFTAAFLVYGFSLLYGLTTKTNLLEIYNSVISLSLIYSPVLLIAFLMIFVSLAFKTSLIPFHMWTGDVYKGASPSVNIFLSCSSKFAVFSLFMKFISLTPFAIYFIYIISILTITIGSLLAIRENNIKKIMAYSTVAQAGFILSGLTVFNYGYNLTPMFYYIFIYMIMNIACWIVIELISNNEKLEYLNDIKGLFYINPFCGICFSIALISLAGLPVTAGFFSKFYLLKSIFFAGEFYYLLFFAVLLNTILGVFYYLKILKYIFSKHINRAIQNLGCYNSKILLLLSVIMLLAGGFFPDILKNYVESFSQITSYEQID